MADELTGNVFDEDIEVKDPAPVVEAPKEQEVETEEVEDETTDDEDYDVDKAKEKIRKVNSEARNLRKKVKELEAAQSSKSSEESKLQDRIQKLEAALSLSTRKEIALEAGLPLSWASRLQGDDEDVWREDAEALADELKQLTRAAKTTTNPGASRARSGVKELSEGDAFFQGL